MDHIASSCHRCSPPSSSNHLFDLFAVSPSSSFAAVGNERNEAELFYAAIDTSKLENQHPSLPPMNKNLRQSFYQNFDILAMLSKFDYSLILCQKLLSLSMMMVMIPSILMPSGDDYFSQLVVAKSRRNVGNLSTVDDGDDDEMLPLHEIAVWGSRVLLNATLFLVLEGVRRTLKRKDLHQVRNAIWCKTSFLN